MQSRGCLNQRTPALLRAILLPNWGLAPDSSPSLSGAAAEMLPATVAMRREQG